MRIACFWIDKIAIATERMRITGLWGEPLALTSEDGLIIVCSDEAASRGVSAGQTAAVAKLFCPTLYCLPYDRETYNQAASMVWNALILESDRVEPVRPEVCYVEVVPPFTARRVCELTARLTAALRTDVRSGVAHSKLCAFHGARQGLPGRAYVVPADEGHLLLASLPIQELPGIHEKLLLRLSRLGLRTCGDLLLVPPDEIRRKFGASGHWLRRLAQGHDGAEVRSTWPPREVEREQCFEFEVESAPMIHRALQRLCERIEAELLSTRELCRTLKLHITLSDQCYLEQREQLPSPLSGARSLLNAAMRLLQRMEKVFDRPVAAVRLTAGELGAGGGLQLELIDLFGNPLPQARLKRLQAMTRSLESKFGIGALMPLRAILRGRRIDLWTYPSTRCLGDPCEVILDTQGSPARIIWRGECYGVHQIQQHWRETDWTWNTLTERSTYRIETPSGLFDVQCIGTRWRLIGVQD